MDFSKKFMDDLGHDAYSPMNIDLLPPLHIIYSPNLSDFGDGKVHSTFRQRWLDGDEFIKSSMKEVANLPLEGRSALTGKDYTKLARLMNHNFELRRDMFGDDALGALNIETVEVAHHVDAASKFTGSGGAVVVLCPDGRSQVKLLEDACHEATINIEPIQLVPSCLSGDELRILYH